MQSTGMLEARSPFARTSQAPNYSKQLAAVISILLLGVAVAILSLWNFFSADDVQAGGPVPGGPLRGYTWWNLFAILFWLMAGPSVVAGSLKTMLLAYKQPEVTYTSRVIMSIVFVLGSVVMAFVGAYWLQASELLACGYIWCYAAEPTANPKPVVYFAGTEVFFACSFISFAAVVVLIRTCSAPKVNGAEVQERQALEQTKGAERRHRLKQCIASAALLVAHPLMLIVTGLLPNTFTQFSRAGIKSFITSTMGIAGEKQSEVVGAWMVTQNWHWGYQVVVKLFPDTMLLYTFLQGIVIVCILQALFEPVQKILSRKMGRTSVGSVALLIWFSLYLLLFVFYWIHDHNFGSYNQHDILIEKIARTSGVVAAMTLGLLLLPASKSSPLLAAAGVSWESALWVHVCLGVLFLVAAACHVLLFFIRFNQLGHGLDIMPFNARFWYPQNPAGGTTPSDDWTVPMMSSVFWPAAVVFGVLPWMRRKHYELFRYTHNWFLILIPAAFWHATSSWYYLLPGVTLWILDRLLRFLCAIEPVTVTGYMPHTVDCWTDARPGQPSRNVPEKITKLCFTWSGQTRAHSPGMYVLVNLPQVSIFEWHPFSLSSSPADPASTLHIKHMGDGTFTAKLHDFMNKVPRPNDIVMNIQGPYGPKISIDSVPHLMLVAGGIGVTPMVNTLRFAVQRAKDADIGVLRRLHFVWSARSPEVFDIFADELSMRTEDLPFQLIMSLYCSTISNSTQCSIGNVIPGMPNFSAILAAETELGSCMLRACGPPPMVKACAEAAKPLKDRVDFEPWSFVL